MPNMSLEKVKMPELEPQVRNQNFKEVALGYTQEQAMEEATRCLNCKHRPCTTGCPVGVPIPEFIAQVAQGNFEEAYDIITSENALPAICGRVCPQENQCEGKCVRAIKGEAVGIGRLERFVADYHREHGTSKPKSIEKNGKKVAVIGSGPAGMTCAGELAKKGYDVTVFEALHQTGGVLSYGIPEFRLPKDLVQKEIDGVAQLGVRFVTNVVVGRSLTIDELQAEGYQAIFVGSGAGLPRFQNIPGENLNGVYSANEFLTRVNLMKGYEFPKLICCLVCAVVSNIIKALCRNLRPKDIVYESVSCVLGRRIAGNEHVHDPEAQTFFRINHFKLRIFRKCRRHL